MASNRDQLQSYQFVLARMMHALVLRETDPEHPPFRRGIIAMFVGVGLAVLALVAVGIYGLINPGGKTSWRSGDAVIVERETGARYVYRDGVLYPAANYTSALLLAEPSGAGKPELVSQQSLLGVPRGPMVGIPDAPDSVPKQDRLLDADWSLCAQPVTDAAGNPAVRSVLLVGREPVDARPVEESALLVIDPDGRRYLVWRGNRHRVASHATVSAGLALDNEAWLPVSAAWLDTIPSGPALGPVEVSDPGSPSELVPSGRVGTLYVVRTSGGQRQHYLLLRDRLMPITPLQYDIQRSAPETRAAYAGATPEAIPLDPAMVAHVSGRDAMAPPSDASLPATRPAFVRPGSAAVSVCAAFADGDFQPRITIAADPPASASGAATTGSGPGGLPLADRVVVPPGHGAVVEAMAAPGQPAGSGALAFVSDLGRRHQLADRELLGVLGYEKPPVVRLPAELVSRIPAGNPLDPEAAIRPLGP